MPDGVLPSYNVGEPVFRFIKQELGFRQFLLRGLEKVGPEWELVNLGYNVRTNHGAAPRGQRRR